MLNVKEEDNGSYVVFFFGEKRFDLGKFLVNLV